MTMKINITSPDGSLWEVSPEYTRQLIDELESTQGVVFEDTAIAVHEDWLYEQLYTRLRGLERVDWLLQNARLLTFSPGMKALLTYGGDYNYLVIGGWVANCGIISTELNDMADMVKHQTLTPDEFDIELVVTTD